MSKIRQFIPDEDAPLLLSWHRGDLSAFESLVWKYQKRIYNLAIFLTGDLEAAATATENSFLTAYQEIRTLTGRSRFSTWLVAITLKECRTLNYFKTTELPSEVPIPVGLHDAVDTDNRHAMAKELALCIKDLPVELTEVILLRYVRGYPLEKMEEVFQIRADVILSRLFEAEETLTTCLKHEIFKAAGSSGQIANEAAAPHPEIRRTFSAYLDSTVENAEKESTKAHLKSCGSCREALADLEWMIEHLKSLPDEEPPQRLTSAIMEKARNIPYMPAEEKRSPSFTIQMTVVTLSLAVIGFSAYLLTRREEPSTAKPGAIESRSDNRTVKTAPEKNPGPADMTSLLKGAFRGSIRPDDKGTKVPVPRPPGLPPQETSPATQSSLITPATRQEVPSAPLKAEPFQKREGAESSPQLPAEWGDSPPPVRTTQKTAPSPRRSGSDLSVVLSTSDPVAAIQGIEAAVAATGGKITGRAFSSGNDILYTRIEAEKLIALVGRLGKVGKIQELPDLPDTADGMIDLIIRW